jgi:hypothetical protein
MALGMVAKFPFRRDAWRRIGHCLSVETITHNEQDTGRKNHVLKAADRALV